MRRLISCREWVRTPTSVDRSPVFHCQLQLSGIWIESGSLTHIINTGSHITAVDNPSFGLNTQSCNQPNTSWVCLNKNLRKMRLRTNPLCVSCELEEKTALHFVCVCLTVTIMRTRIFGKPIMNAMEIAEVSASAILRFAFQSGKLETNLWANFLQYVSRLFNL
jgi:hypothetical protein